MNYLRKLERKRAQPLVAYYTFHVNPPETYDDPCYEIEPWPRRGEMISGTTDDISKIIRDLLRPS